jgi:hypothetical protein
MGLNYDMQLIMSGVLKHHSTCRRSYKHLDYGCLWQTATAAGWFCLHDRFSYDHCHISGKVRQGLACPSGSWVD